MKNQSSFSRYGIDMRVNEIPLGFQYGENIMGPAPEIRSLDQIRSSLRDPHCQGPKDVYAIAMDVAQKQDVQSLKKQMLLFGVVTYAKGKLGNEPIRSQGHIHKISQHSGWSPPELYEVWQGRAIIYMQEYVDDNAGRCFAVHAKEGEHVLVPPGWAHATLSADPSCPLTFAAWCDREYGFKYDAVRARQGLAWYPLLQEGHIIWQHNSNYNPSRLQSIQARRYSEFGITDEPLYLQYQQEPERFQFISKPSLARERWKDFRP